MNKIIVEVGSTVTKVDKYDGAKVERLKEITIFFKKHYKEEKKLNEKDIQDLLTIIQDLKKSYQDIYVCGTSIFRDLKETEKEEFLQNFKNETELDFHIISQEKEGDLTIKGATRNVREKVCVFIGGGGSTEIAIYDNGIIESINSSIGVVDVMEKFPDLANDIATTSLEEVMNYIKENLKLPKNKADILVLAGGGHKYFALESGITYENNTLYEDIDAPIMMSIESRIKDTKRYFENTSLDKIRNRVEDQKWWFATRAMCAFVLVIAEEIEAKYIVPTDIAMAYGLINE